MMMHVTVSDDTTISDDNGRATQRTEAGITITGRIVTIVMGRTTVRPIDHHRQLSTMLMVAVG